MMPNLEGKTPLDIAVDANQIRSIPILLEMMNHYQNNISLNYAIDKKFCKIISLGVDLKEYLITNLSITQIMSSNYPTMH